MVIPFAPSAQTQAVHPYELVPHAVRSMETSIADLVNAANAANSDTDACDLQMVIRDLIVKLEAASMVAWHRETMFFPKGA